MLNRAIELDQGDCHTDDDPEQQFSNFEGGAMLLMVYTAIAYEQMQSALGKVRKKVATLLKDLI